MSERLKEAQLACMILTRLPAGRIDGDAPPMAQAVWAFPLVGVVVGGLMGLGFAAATTLGLPTISAALIALVISALATGAMHEDGLADVADGFGGGHTVERKLEIMRDSRIGSYGVLALVLIVALTASGMSAAGTILAFTGISTISRTAMLLPMAFLPPARTDGLGRNAQVDPNPAFATAFGITLVIALLTGALFAAFLMVIVTAILMVIARAQIGGQTGDVLGATQKLSECTGWLTLAALSA